MRVSRSLLAASVALCVALPAAAQSVGVLQSAETMDRGVFKLMLAPIMVFGEDDAESEFGLAARAGYGFTDRFDAEAKLGFFENSTVVGADGELWIVRGEEPDSGLDFSVAGGVHWAFGKSGHQDTMGFEITPLLSGHVTGNLELCGALAASFESIQDAPAGMDDSFTSLYIVPGVEYRLSDAADLVGEVGIALNDESSTYAGIGIAYYLR